MSMVGFPLLLVPIAIYNIVVFLMPGVSFAEPLFKVTLLSGAVWPVTVSDLLVALGMILLLLEVIKGARPGAKYLTDHFLSLVLFGAAAAEFLLWPKFANSTYFLLTLLALVEFLSGISLRLRRATRPVRRVAEPPMSEPAEREMSQPRSEPRLETPSAPRAPLPSAASVAESVLADRSQPAITPSRGPSEAEPSPAPGTSPTQ